MNRLRKTFFKDQLKNNQRRRVLIVGAGEVGKKVAQEILEHYNSQCELVGFVDDDTKVQGMDGIPILGSRAQVPKIVERYGIDEIIIAYAPTWQQELFKKMLESGKGNLKIKILPSLYETLISKLKFEQIEDLPLLPLTGQVTSRSYDIIKRAIDITVSLVSLILALPVLLIVALAIKLTSKGPVFFTQERVGKDGKIFTIYKFRTMIQDAEKLTGPVLSNPNDERVTFIGKFLRRTRIDELPQFINVLKGEMSLVGPRPERPVFAEKYKQKISLYAMRDKVKPGITGLAQVYGNYLTSAYDKLRYDLMYIYNQSILLDLKILCQTIKIVLAGAGT